MLEQTNLQFPPSVILPDASHYDRFWQYIYERQAIWHRRFVLKLPRPWTTDEVLLNYSFTNVYRQLDRGTVFYIENILQPLLDSGASYDDIVFCTLAYRRFNRVDTWENCFAQWIELPEWNEAMLDHIEHSLRNMAMLRPVFTGAFWVCGYPTYPGHDKIAKMINFLRTDLYNRNTQVFSRMLHRSPTPQRLHQQLKELDGIGAFLAYEVYSDLMYLENTRLALPFKEDDWANPGPGAQKGLQLINPNRSDYEQQMYELRDVQHEAFRALNLPFEKVAYKHLPLTMRNIEHNLCEYSKYARGKARARFTNHGDHLYEGTSLL